MDERTVIRRVQGGDADAYALLVRKHHRSLLAFIFRIVRDAHLAEDIGQEVFLRVYRELAGFDPDRGTPFAAWLFIVARNQCISELRRLRRTAPVAPDALDLLAASGESSEAVLIRQEELAALEQTLQELPEPFRTTILMSLQGASLEEIAGRCGVPQATVKSRLFRAREKLAQLMKGHFGGVAHERRV